ncbi:MAG: RND transporter [Haliea sp.]|uniref:efflux RND transporter periplasmic adaptor subunit n=1 Tax=Haliea sp. TaxID=1932666 RepID=UPI000C649386|nr:HlyD family efflux transporter periplasmic adaptor subunit [Haliea sp.]MBM70549.1 RND transporter [Haliea sp.]|tara:strand:- start:17796 stop:19025 length:1230 start_codon:yes stop_codon:yes gene_type:complete
MTRKHSRPIISLTAGLIVAASLVFAFWPRPLLVDLAVVERGTMRVTIDEEGRTRVHDAYVLATPVAGRLQRVEVLPGDAVVHNQTVVAQMLPSNPDALNIRTREQALTEVAAAEAALRLARAELNKAVADSDLAKTDLERVRRLRGNAMVSEADLDRAVRAARSAEAVLGTAEAAIAMREAQLANARASLISFQDADAPAGAILTQREAIPLYAPATGRVLRVLQESETTLPAGTAILEIGNIENDLEVVVELLSTDAVKVSPGDPVILEDWGGPATLHGVVERVDPLGFTKFSALGVEEQRVNTIVQFTEPADARRALGHGYRVEARIIIWEADNVLKLPASALFRHGSDWAVFREEGGKARLTPVTIGRNNGIDAEVLEGLQAGDTIVLYPGSSLGDGVRIRQRAAG